MELHREGSAPADYIAGLFSKRITDSVSQKGVSRTAPATPSLLTTDHAVLLLANTLFSHRNSEIFEGYVLSEIY